MFPYLEVAVLPRQDAEHIDVAAPALGNWIALGPRCLKRFQLAPRLLFWEEEGETIMAVLPL